MKLEDKTCLVTGANSGIGRLTAEKLAEKGARVVGFCRSRKRCSIARKEIIEKTNNQDVHLIVCDLSLMSSVREAVKEYRRDFDHLDVLVNNAGLILSKRKITEEGNEKTFASNYLGHFLLTYQLLDIIKDSTPSRIINVVSEAHKRGHLDFKDLQMKNTERFSGFKAYANSKLAMTMWTYTLAKKLRDKDITVNCYHPGVVKSEFGKNAPGVKFFYTIFSFLMRAPTDSAEEIVNLAGSQEMKGRTGLYFSKGKTARSSKESYDEQKQKALWKKSKKIVGL